MEMDGNLKKLVENRLICPDCNSLASVFYYSCDFCNENHCEYKKTIPEICRECGVKLTLHYSYIINKLRKKCWLDKDFKPICCECGGFD